MISIIIPIYNGKKTIKKTLRSILNQSYKNYEVIAVNDGSSDNSLEILKSFSNNFWDRKIRYKIVNQKNQGAPSARNNGFSESRGEYLFFCDADVVLRKNCLQIMLDTLEKNPNASYVYSSFFWGFKLFRLFAFDKEKLKKMPYIHSTSLIRKLDFPKCGWDTGIKKLQDWDLWLEFLKRGKVGIFVDKILFRVITGGTMSAWFPKIFFKLFWQPIKIKKEIERYNEAMEVIKIKHNLK